MRHLLHLISTPRQEASHTLRISSAVLERLTTQYPELQVETLDLFQHPMPSMTSAEMSGKYRLLSGKELDDETRPAWIPIETEITRFMRADIVLISTPMWNYGVPYVLKHYFDVILQPRYLFRYTPEGPEGLAKGKKVVVAASCGGDYSEQTGTPQMDHLTPWLRTILGFIGISDPLWLIAQPTIAGGPQVAEQQILAAIEKAKQLTVVKSA